MAIYELHDAENTLVNTILLDDESAWPVPDGHTLIRLPDPEPIPENPVPQAVSRFQARAALHIHGVLADVETAVNSADPIAQIAWADAQQFERQSPTIASIADALGWSDAFVDALFITAGGITA